MLVQSVNALTAKSWHQSTNSHSETDLEAARIAHNRLNTYNVAEALLPNGTSRRKVAFLFMMKERLQHEDVWNSFFTDASPDMYSIYIHQAAHLPRGTGDRHPLKGNGAIAIPRLPEGWCELSGMQAGVFVEALRDPANVQFVLVSSNTVPLKPFSYVYSQLVEKSPETSKLCYAPNSFNKCSYNPEKNIPGWWKHHQFLILSRQHVFQHLKHLIPSLEASYSLNIVSEEGPCSDEYVVSATLLKGQTERLKQQASEGVLEGLGVERACLTWEYWDGCFEDTPLEIVPKVPEFNGAYSFGGLVVEEGGEGLVEGPSVSLAYLRGLVKDEGFMFGRKFAAGTMVGNAKSTVKLVDVLPGLWQEVNETHASMRVWSSNDAHGSPEGSQ